MPYFNPTPTGNSVPEYKNQYLRSTNPKPRFESATVAASAVASETIDGETRKVLQSGEVLARITSGPEIGKVGPFQASATDGRADVANIVGVNDTYEPWRLLPQEGSAQDVEVGYVYDGTCVQGWCFERNAAGARIPLTDATANALRGAKHVHILFH